MGMFVQMKQWQVPQHIEYGWCGWHSAPMVLASTDGAMMQFKDVCCCPFGIHSFISMYYCG
jgi:hypothetical protein